MKKWLAQFKTEDWVVVAVSTILLALAAIIPNHLPRIPKDLLSFENWQNTLYLFIIVLGALYIGWLLLGKPLKGLFSSHPTSILLRIRIGVFLCYLWSSHPQFISCTNLDEACHTKRILYQNRRSVPRCHNSLQ